MEEYIIGLCLNVNPTLTRTQGFIQHQLESFFFFKSQFKCHCWCINYKYMSVFLSPTWIYRMTKGEILVAVYWNEIMNERLKEYSHMELSMIRKSSGTFPKKYTYKQTFQILFLMRPLIKRHVWIEACWQNNMKVKNQKNSKDKNWQTSKYSIYISLNKLWPIYHLHCLMNCFWGCIIC